MDEINVKSEFSRILLKIGIVLSFLALLVWIGTRNFVGHGYNSPPWKANMCINNLRQIDAAKEQWALEQNKTNLETVVAWNDVKPYLGRSDRKNDLLKTFSCPLDKTKQYSNSYTLGDLKTPPKCTLNPATHHLN